MSIGNGTWKARTYLGELGAAASFVSMVVATLLVLVGVAGITSATLRFVSQRSDRTLWEMKSITSLPNTK